MVEVGVTSCLIKTKGSSFKQYGKVSLPSSVRTTITPVTMDQSLATNEPKSLKLSCKFSLLHPLIRSLARIYFYSFLALFVCQNFSLDGIYVTVNIRHELGLDRPVAASPIIFKRSCKSSSSSSSIWSVIQHFWHPVAFHFSYMS